MPDTTDTSPTYRLTDMEVKEVSIVDRAANKRRFLVVKRSETMPAGAEVVANADGSLTTTPASAPAAAPAQTPAPTTTVKSDASLTADAQSTFGKILDEAIAKLTEAKKQVEGAKAVETEAEIVADPICGPIMEVAGALEDACYALLDMSGSSTEEEGAEGEEGTEGTEGDAEGAVEPPPMGKRYAVLAAKRVVKRAQADLEFRDMVKKFGRKMKKERLARFQQAHQILGSLLTELVSDQAAEAAKTTEKANSEAVAKAASDLTSTKVELVKANSLIADLQKQLKTLSEQQAALQDKRGGPNALPVDEDSTRIAKSGEFQWPMDMNAPRGKSNVKKGDFFGGE